MALTTLADAFPDVDSGMIKLQTRQLTCRDPLRLMPDTRAIDIAREALEMDLGGRGSNAEGYFDMNYNVEFVGASFGPFAGMGGIFSGTSRITLGDETLTEVCDLPDNGFGTVDLPPQCDAGFVGSLTLSSEFPSGVQLDVETRIFNFSEFTYQLLSTCHDAEINDVAFAL